MPPTRPRTERRLLGYWKSDRKKTCSNWVYPKKLANAKRKWFEDLFGKLTLRFTPTFAYADINGAVTRVRYTVIWSDAESCIVQYDDEGVFSTQQIVFEEPFYSVRVGNNVEYFRRVTKFNTRTIPKKRNVRQIQRTSKSHD